MKWNIEWVDLQNIERMVSECWRMNKRQQEQYCVNLMRQKELAFAGELGIAYLNLIYELVGGDAGFGWSDLQKDVHMMQKLIQDGLEQDDLYWQNKYEELTGEPEFYFYTSLGKTFTDLVADKLGIGMTKEQKLLQLDIQQIQKICASCDWSDENKAKKAAAFLEKNAGIFGSWLGDSFCREVQVRFGETIQAEPITQLELEQLTAPAITPEKLSRAQRKAENEKRKSKRKKVYISAGLFFIVAFFLVSGFFLFAHVPKKGGFWNVRKPLSEDMPAKTPDYVAAEQIPAGQSEDRRALARQTSDGRASAGQSEDGQTSAGQSATGRASAGQSATGRASAGQSATGRASAGQSETGQTSAPRAVEDQDVEDQGAIAQDAADRSSIAQDAAGQGAIDQNVADTGMEDGNALEQEQPEVLQKYQNFHNKYPDLFGWLKIPDTEIDQPVMQSDDENTDEKYFYLSHDYAGNKTAAGSLFVDSKSSCYPQDDNTVIYGHNMQNGHNFGMLCMYEDPDFLKEHPLVQYDTIYETGTYQIVAVLKSRILYQEEEGFRYYRFFNYDSEDAFLECVNFIKSSQIYDTGHTLAYGDRLLMLSTCDYSQENGRLVIVAKKIR